MSNLVGTTALSSWMKKGGTVTPDSMRDMAPASTTGDPNSEARMPLYEQLGASINTDYTAETKAASAAAAAAPAASVAAPNATREQRVGQTATSGGMASSDNEEDTLGRPRAKKRAASRAIMG